KQKNDSIYVAADTIFSGYSTEVKNEQFILKKDSVVHDTLHQKILTDTTLKADSLHRKPQLKKYSERDSANYLAHVIDSLNANKNDKGLEKIKKAKENPVLSDSLKTMAPKDSLANRNNEKLEKIQKTKKYPVLDDSAKTISPKDSLKIDSLKARKINEELEKIKAKEIHPLSDTAKMISAKSDSASIDSLKHNITTSRIRSLDSSKMNHKDTLSKPDSSRYFLAFHHVRIFSDSLQSVCDSLFFSAKDSVFRLYYDPVLWSGRTQITGDTIFLYTKNKKAERLYAFDKGIIVNKTTQGFFNQISGK